MPCSVKYIEESLYYEPWKTKFIEAFCPLYAQLRIKSKHQTNEEFRDFVFLYLSVFKLMINVLKRKLRAKNNIRLKFNSDIINFSLEAKLIHDKKLFFEVLNFYNQCNLDKNYTINFNWTYLKILEQFHIKFKQLTKDEGFRNRDYYIYDNSYCLWGIHEKYYRDLINIFYSFDKLKIVRIFGSRVTDNYNEFSDIDLICEGVYNFSEFIEMQNKIKSIETPYIIDMYDIYNNSKPFIYRNVVRSNILYEREKYTIDNYKSII